MEAQTERLTHYEELRDREARFWGEVRPQPDTPQLWQDPALAKIFHEPFRQAVISRVSSIGGDILELGCGEGEMAIELALRGINVRAVDLSGERIKRAREKARILFDHARFRPPEFQVADLNAIDLATSRYDCIVAFDALHHVLNLPELMEKAHGALRPRGWLVVHDYVGMGLFRKFMAATLYALLPTYKSYAKKARLARRLPHFLSGEKTRRKRLRTLPPDAFERESPFEEVSLKSIEKEIEKKFEIVERSDHHPFFFYLAAKMRTPRRMRASFGRFLHSLDNLLIRSAVCRGAYVLLVARKPG